MHKGIENLVSQLANNFVERPSYEATGNQPASYITERRNKKRKELAQSIFDQNPFAGPNHPPFGPNGTN